MKKTILTVGLLLFLTWGIMPSLFSQSPAPPNGDGSNPTTSGHNNPVGGGAPIDGGLSILLALGASYGGNKLFKTRKERSQTKPDDILDG